jgi:hypothetical protein
LYPLDCARVDFLRHIDRAGHSGNGYARAFSNFFDAHRYVLAEGPDALLTAH